MIDSICIGLGPTTENIVLVLFGPTCSRDVRIPTKPGSENVPNCSFKMRVFGSVDDRVETGIEDQEDESKWGALKPNVRKDADAVGYDAKKEPEEHVETVLGDARFQLAVVAPKGH